MSVAAIFLSGPMIFKFQALGIDQRWNHLDGFHFSRDCPWHLLSFSDDGLRFGFHGRSDDGCSGFGFNTGSYDLDLGSLVYRMFGCQVFRMFGFLDFSKAFRLQVFRIFWMVF